MAELNEKAGKGEQRTICEACGNSNLAHDRAVWTDDGSSFCPECVALPAPEEVVFCPNCGWNSAMDAGPATPDPDDGLIGKLLEAADDWRRLSDPENEELMLAAATALQSNEAAKQQVQKLTAENERIKGQVREAVKFLDEGYPQHARLGLMSALETQEGGK